MRLVSLVVVSSAAVAFAGPELSLREFAGGQVKKGVRTIGMGGDGATTGNYALVYKDAGGGIFDYGTVHYLDTGNNFGFAGVGFTTPTYWNDAAFYVIALGQRANHVSVWTESAPKAGRPPSIADLSDTSVFVKFAKPITPTLSLGLMGAFELSQATLQPLDGSALIRYHTTYLPSGGVGLHWHPDEMWQVGVRAIFNHDQEHREQAGVQTEGLARSYEYRAGVGFKPWKWTLLDAGISVLDRSNALEHSSSFQPYPTVGIEQLLWPSHLWLRAGLDETTWTAGFSFGWSPLKLDFAFLYNLAAARIGDVFGKQSASFFFTLNFDLEAILKMKAEAPPRPAAPPAPSTAAPG